MVKAHGYPSHATGSEIGLKNLADPKKARRVPGSG